MHILEWLPRNTGKQIVEKYLLLYLTGIALAKLLQESSLRCRPLFDVTMGSTGEWDSKKKTIFFCYTKIVRIQAVMKTIYLLYLKIKKNKNKIFFYSGFAAGHHLLLKR